MRPTLAESFAVPANHPGVLLPSLPSPDVLLVAALVATLVVAILVPSLRHLEERR